MSTASARSIARSGRAAPSASGGPSLRVWLIGLAVVAGIVFLLAWLLGWIRFTTDPRVAEILALQEQARERFEQRNAAAATSGSPGMTLADATTAVTSMMEIRQKTEALPEYLRPQVERNGANMFRSAFRARIDRYFAVPPEQRQAEIDRQIAEEEMWRKAFEAGRAMMAAVSGGSQQGQSANQQAASNPRPWSSRTEDERNRWRKGIVDRTTPEERARYTEWRRARDARREQLGLPTRWRR